MTLTCPFCNAVIPPMPGLVLGQRIACPRCGEMFAVSHVPDTPVAPVISPMRERVVSKPVRANRLVGAIVLGTMLLFAGVGLAFALATVQMRRDHDHALPRKQRKPWLLGNKPADEELAVSPARLVGLRYLPSSTNFVAALHVEELLNGTLGKDLQEKSWKVDQVDLSLASMKEWTGLAAEDIDHIVVGVDFGDGGAFLLMPPVHIVVRALRSDGANRMRVALKATSGRKEKTPEGSERMVYAFTVKNIPMHLWAADDRTIVIDVFNKLERVPGKPTEDITHLPLELREMIEKRLAAGTPFWAVGHSTNWKQTWLSRLLGPANELPLVSRLNEVQTFGLWLVPTRPVKLGGAFRFADEAAAQKAVKEDLEPRAKANPETFRFTQTGPWVDVLQTLEWGRER